MLNCGDVRKVRHLTALRRFPDEALHVWRGLESDPHDLDVRAEDARVLRSRLQGVLVDISRNTVEFVNGKNKNFRSTDAAGRAGNQSDV